MIGGKTDRIIEDCIWDKEAQIEYINAPNLIAIYNQERVNIERYGEESIERYSTFINQQFDEQTPSWAGGFIQQNLLVDQTDFFRWGEGEVEKSFNTIKWDLPVPSSMTIYPSKEKPDGQYKFCGFNLLISVDSQITERETYQLLEWMGDIGGLLDALLYLGRIIIAPITSYSL